MGRSAASLKKERVYQRKYKHLMQRSPRSNLKYVTITSKGVTCLVRTEVGWKPVSFGYASGLAADVAVLRDALDLWDDLVAQEKAEAKHGS